MDHSHNSMDIEAPSPVSLQDTAPSNEEIASGEIEELAASLEDGHPSAEESTLVESLVSAMWDSLIALPMRPNTLNGSTIHRVSADLRKNKERLIEPSVVSIGPYHRGCNHLEPMEYKKRSFLQDILSSLEDGKVTLKACVEKIKGIQLQARNCYSESIDMDDDSFVEMLILDGTFIVQLIFKSLSSAANEMGWAFNSTSVWTDLILMENRIPFFVVEILWLVYFEKPLDFNDLRVIIVRQLDLYYYIGNITESIFEPENSKPIDKFHHLLHLCRHALVPDMSASAHPSVLPECSCFINCIDTSSQHDIQHDTIFPCAAQLEDAGIKFREKKHPRIIVDVTFLAGKLEIPFIPVGNSSMRIFHNLLVFEQCQDMSFRRYFTSYAIFMDSIINTKHDVAILQRHSIIGEMISSEAEVAGFFNQLCEGAYIVSIKDYYLIGVVEGINWYYHSKYHRNCSQLIRNYFNSLWSIISLFAACILLGLTFVQTYFAGYDYFHPSPK